jgi:hypothetical protein
MRAALLLSLCALAAHAGPPPLLTTQPMPAEAWSGSVCQLGLVGEGYLSHVCSGAITDRGYVTSAHCFRNLDEDMRVARSWGAIGPLHLALCCGQEQCKTAAAFTIRVKRSALKTFATTRAGLGKTWSTDDDDDQVPEGDDIALLESASLEGVPSAQRAIPLAPSCAVARKLLLAGRCQSAGFGRRDLQGEGDTGLRVQGRLEVAKRGKGSLGWLPWVGPRKLRGSSNSVELKGAPTAFREGDSGGPVMCRMTSRSPWFLVGINVTAMEVFGRDEVTIKRIESGGADLLCEERARQLTAEMEWVPETGALPATAPQIGVPPARELGAPGAEAP